MADAHKNFAYSTVATAPSPATSGTSLVVAAGQGALFPTPPFNVTIWPVSTQPISTNAEIVRVSAIVTDTLTIARAQENTSARTVVVGDQIAATITAKALTDVEAVVSRRYKSGFYYQTNQAAAGDTTMTPTLNLAYFHPFPVGEALSIDRITCGVQTSGAATSVVRLGIYNDTDGIPSTLLLDAGTVDGAAAAGYREITLSPAQALAQGTLYWICTVWQVATVGVLRSSAVGAGADWVGSSAASSDPRFCTYTQAGVTGALPSPATIVSSSGVTSSISVKVRAV